MKKIIITFCIVFIFNTSSFADKRFDVDLKKISKLNSFINNKGEPYQLDKNIDKDKTIILIYTHGSWGDEKGLNGCNKKWSKIPPAIYQLDGSKIMDFTIKTYQLCSGVRGWTKKEEDLFWDVYDKNKQDVNSVLKLKDKKGELLANKWKSPKRQKVVKLKIDEFKNKGFKNIVLSGHSAGWWDSLLLKSNFPSEVDGVIAFNPARSGKFAKNKKPHRGWVNWRKYKVSLIKVDKLEKVLVYSHEKDAYENTKTLSFLSSSNTVEFIDLTNTKCKKKTILGGWHGITLTKCFADQDPKSKKIIKYLEEVY